MKILTWHFISQLHLACRTYNSFKGEAHTSVSDNMKVAIHCFAKADAILFGGENGGLFPTTTEDAGLFDPALQLFVPSVRPDIIWFCFVDRSGKC